MEENDKKEELKKVLGQTLSQEEIEEKLKKEIRNKLDSQNSEIPEITVEKLSEDTPEIKPITQKKEKYPINILIYIFSAITIILLGITFYLFMKTPSETKPKEVIVTKEVIVPKEIVKEVVKEKIVPKIVDLDNKNFKKYYNEAKFNTFKCYSFKEGSSLLTTQCKKDLDKFLDKNKNSLRFEIIPVVSPEDSLIFNKIKVNIDNFGESFKNKVKEYLLRGLSKERVLEATTYIKKHFKVRVIITPTSYYVTSQKNNKGVIIKAYYY